MSHPEGSRQGIPPPQEKATFTINEIEHQLELNEANENTIERTKKREELLELLDWIEESD